MIKDDLGVKERVIIFSPEYTGGFLA